MTWSRPSGWRRPTRATGASRLSGALQAQYYTKGLGFLAPGTPTNNTPASRSGWSSRPAPLPPEEIDSRRSLFDADGSSDAARLARALGIDGRAGPRRCWTGSRPTRATACRPR